MQLSQRGLHMPSSPIRRLVPLADAAHARGTHVYHLNIGQPDIPTPRPVIAAYQNYDEHVLAYGPSAGLPELREALAAYYQPVNPAVDASWVHVTTGGSEALLFAMAAITDPGDELIVFEPFYANYAGFAHLLGTRLNPVMSHATDGFALPPDATIEAAIGPRTRGIIICSPGNPTGTVYSRDELQRLARLIEKHQLTLISDEVYREFAYEGPVTSALELGIDQRVIVCDSISKRFSACGARVGNVVTANPDLFDAIQRFGFSRLCPATVDQQAAIAAYALPPTIFAPIVAEYRARRDALISGLNTLPGVQTYVPQGAFYTMVTLPIADADAFCRWLLTDFSHDNKTVMLAPGNGFYATPDAGLNQARMAYVLNIPAIEDSVALLGRALASHPDRTG